jgi:hypothetical protein
MTRRWQIATEPGLLGPDGALAAICKEIARVMPRGLGFWEDEGRRILVHELVLRGDK